MGELTVREVARRGGRQTLSKHGRQHFRNIGRKGGQRTKELYRDKFREWGSAGGRPRKATLDQMEGEETRK